MRKDIVFIAVRSYALYSSRYEILQYYIDRGFTVHVVCNSDHSTPKLIELGVHFHDFSFLRGRFGFADLIAAYKVVDLIKKVSPLLVVSFHLKPIFYSSFIANRIPRVNIITGLGRAFPKLKSRFHPYTYLLRFALKKSFTIVQNTDHRNFLIDKNLLLDSKSICIKGSGVDVFRFVYPNGKTFDEPLKFLMVTRLLKSKGVVDFLSLSDIFSSYNVEFILIGEVDTSSSDSISIETIDKYSNVTFLGYQNDILPFLLNSHIFIFPSIYSEGIPRVILEASSCGVVPICYDIPGVRDVITDGVNGFLAPPSDFNSLVSILKSLISNPNTLSSLSLNAVRNVNVNFAKSDIQKQYISTFNKFLNYE